MLNCPDTKVTCSSPRDEETFCAFALVALRFNYPVPLLRRLELSPALKNAMLSFRRCPALLCAWNARMAINDSMGHVSWCMFLVDACMMGARWKHVPSVPKENRFVAR